MVAASFWSLLAPGIDMSPGEGFVKVIPAAVGFSFGALFIFGLDKVLPHLHINFKESEGIKNALAPYHAYGFGHYASQYSRRIGCGCFVWRCCRRTTRGIYCWRCGFGHWHWYTKLPRGYCCFHAHASVGA